MSRMDILIRANNERRRGESSFLLLEKEEISIPVPKWNRNLSGNT